MNFVQEAHRLAEEDAQERVELLPWRVQVKGLAPDLNRKSLYALIQTNSQIKFWILC